MIGLAAGFIVLATSVGGVAILIASAVLAFFDHSGPAWRHRMATKVAVSLSVCYGSSLFLYCAEAAPSLLFDSPVYGRTVHVAAGWVAVAVQYGSVLHIFLLSVLKIDFLYELDAKRDRASWISVIFIWLIAGVLSVLVMDRACTYMFSVEHILYRCENPDDSPRLLIVCATLSAVFLLVSAILVVYRYFANTGEKAQKLGDAENVCQDLLLLRKAWSVLLANELVLAGAKMVTVASTSALADRMLRWHGLAATVLLVLFETLALWLYFRAMTRALQIYVRVEGARRQSRAVSQRRVRRCHSRGSVGSRHSRHGSIGSRHSCRGSSRRSQPDIVSTNHNTRRNGGNRVMPLDVEALERTEVVVGPPGSVHSWHKRDEMPINHEGETSRLRTVPVVQVQVYRSYEGDMDSLCNYRSDSDTECDSLKERSERSLGVTDPGTPTTPLSMSPPTTRCACANANCSLLHSTSLLSTQAHFPSVDGNAAREHLPVP